MRLDEERAERRTYCVCAPHEAESFWDSLGLADSYPQGLGLVTRVRRQDARHMVPPLYMIGLPHRIEPLGEKWGFAARTLGPADGGYPGHSVHVFRAFRLVPGDSVEPR